MTKTIMSPMYNESYVKFDRKDHRCYLQNSPDGSVFSMGRHATKIFPDDVMRTGKYMKTYLPYSGCTYFRTAGVTDLAYTWCKENHAFKDSILYISFHGALNRTPSDFRHGEVDISGADVILTESGIPAYIDRVRRDSGISVSNIKAEIRRQFKWLDKNEHDYYIRYVGTTMIGRPFSEIWSFMVTGANMT